MPVGRLRMVRKCSSVEGKGSQSCWQNGLKGESAENKGGWVDVEGVQDRQHCGCLSQARLVELAEGQRKPPDSPAETNLVLEKFDIMKEIWINRILNKYEMF